MRRATVLALSLILAGCGQSGSVSPSASSTSQPPPPTPSATVSAEPEPTAQPSPTPVTNGRIAFRRFLDENKSTGEIFTIEPDGTGLKQVTNSPANTVSTEPSWSSDGQWIVYMVAPEGNLDDARLAKIRPDGTDATDLAGACPEACTSDGFPAFAPSGQLIAFERLLPPASDAEFNLKVVFVMDTDGTNARQITQRGASQEQLNPDDGGPTFAPTGELLAFNRRDPDTGLWAIFTVALDGTGEFQVTPWDLDASQPDFSPDGAWILFRSHETSNTQGNVWMVRPDGTDAHAVTDSVDGEEKWLSGSFSPDGLWITNGSTSILDRRQQNADVHVMRLDGSDLRNLTDDLDFWDSAPEWGPAS
jgi:TolB protein